MSRAGGPHQVHVQSDIDVVTLRQQVRQMARMLGLGLTQQARITAAISTVARSLVESECQALFLIQASNQPPHPALEITCQAESIADDPAYTTEAIKKTIHFEEARSLVDEARLALEDSHALLTLRIWLAS